VPGYLLDTNALSMLAPPAVPRAGVGPDRAVAFRAWVRGHDDALFLSVITLAEIQAGISRLERKGAAKRAADLSHWLSAILELYQSRTLPLAPGAALETGRMLDRAMAAGSAPGFEDAAIAAIAAVNDLTVVTANERHFKHFGVALVSPPMR
jgi:predicted nucleic acid-binding protein